MSDATPLAASELRAAYRKRSKSYRATPFAKARHAPQRSLAIADTAIRAFRVDASTLYGQQNSSREEIEWLCDVLACQSRCFDEEQVYKAVTYACQSKVRHSPVREVSSHHSPSPTELLQGIPPPDCLRRPACYRPVQSRDLGMLKHVHR